MSPLGNLTMIFAMLSSIALRPVILASKPVFGLREDRSPAGPSNQHQTSHCMLASTGVVVGVGDTGVSVGATVFVGTDVAVLVGVDVAVGAGAGTGVA